MLVYFEQDYNIHKPWKLIHEFYATCNTYLHGDNLTDSKNLIHSYLKKKKKRTIRKRLEAIVPIRWPITGLYPYSSILRVSVTEQSMKGEQRFTSPQRRLPVSEPIRKPSPRLPRKKRFRPVVTRV